MDFAAPRDDAGGTSWSYKACKTLVRSSASAYQHSVLLPATCPADSAVDILYDMYICYICMYIHLTEYCFLLSALV